MRSPSFVDLSGQTFSRLTVIKYHGQYKWLCRCECGKMTIAAAGDLKRGRHRSCGCLNADLAKTNRRPNIDLTGKEFGRLKVTRYVGRQMWECRCICGVVKNINGRQLREGRTVSCGCYHLERLRIDHTTHGKHETPEFVSWCAMRQRCRDPKSAYYNRYGGRGIKVCTRWLHSFENFLADMGNKPTPKHTIERIDNDGNYEPSNCRWATHKEQTRNRSNTVMLRFRGQSKSLPQWCEELGLSYLTVKGRIAAGWTVERALTAPVHS